MKSELDELDRMMAADINEADQRRIDLDLDHGRPKCNTMKNDSETDQQPKEG